MKATAEGRRTKDEGNDRDGEGKQRLVEERRNEQVRKPRRGLERKSYREPYWREDEAGWR